LPSKVRGNVPSDTRGKPPLGNKITLFWASNPPKTSPSLTYAYPPWLHMHMHIHSIISGAARRV